MVHTCLPRQAAFYYVSSLYLQCVVRLKPLNQFGAICIHVISHVLGRQNKEELMIGVITKVITKIGKTKGKNPLVSGRTATVK